MTILYGITNSKLDTHTGVVMSMAVVTLVKYMFVLFIAQTRAFKTLNHTVSLLRVFLI